MKSYIWTILYFIVVIGLFIGSYRFYISSEKSEKKSVNVLRRIISGVPGIIAAVVLIFLGFSFLFMTVLAMFHTGNSTKVFINERCDGFGLNNIELWDNNDAIKTACQNYYGMTPDEIAKAADLNRKSYYDYFKVDSDYKNISLGYYLKNSGFNFAGTYKSTATLVKRTKTLTLTGILKKSVYNQLDAYEINGYHLAHIESKLNSYINKTIELSIVYNADTADESGYIGEYIIMSIDEE